MENLTNTLFSSFEADEVTFFADLILPIPVPRLFTYRVPREMAEVLKIGARVIVPFGKNNGRVFTAVVARLHNSPPTNYQARYITEVLDEYPLVTGYQLELFRWMAEYYMCCVGEVMNIALPSGLKISSQSKVQINPDFDYPELLTEFEDTLLTELKKQQALSYDELVRLAGAGTNIPALIKSLVGKKAIIVFEEVREKYIPKMVRKVRLNRTYEEKEQLLALLNRLEKLPKQQEVVMRYLSHVPVQMNASLNQKGLDKTILNQDDTVSQSSLTTLIKNAVFETFELIQPRFSDNAPPQAEIKLTDAQREASQQIMAQFERQNIVLLHGITGSGKTEVYIDLIQQAVGSGSQVLYLLPEIALTTQIVVRLQRVFGDKMGIYHSKFSDNERVEVWKGVVSGQYQFVVGVRSAVFLPFDNLGLIIVDEEHETSYKQHDPAPRYHARDVAIMLAHWQQAKVLLGSATPSLETYHQAKQGRYGLVELFRRFGDATLPNILLIDTKVEKRQKTMKNEFSSALLTALEANMERREQSILFQNRRGYSPYMQCEDCDWTAECPNCAVSLTYHQRAAELRCHYCGHKEEVPRICPVCGSTKVRTIGFGTEKLEDQLQIIFPKSKVLRMDLDTTRAKNAYQQIIQEFEGGEIDILVGTQMITKGLDFDNVSLVGIFDADRLIHFPDFRATERSFQMLTQVSGRAGRRAGRQGTVLIQTNNPQQTILQKIIENDYKGLFDEEIQERQNFNYPPFSRLIKLTVRHADKAVSQQAADRLAAELTDALGSSRILGPEQPLVERIRNLFLFDILIKIERDKVNVKAVKSYIQDRINDILTDKGLRQVSIVIDVDCL
ncbi:replication restart helicase PriA [Spirosoma utsteinense]|uniref:Replication restart protein PriA n=1 Tax=Spirosoma utsteinense TaxID=2585773 RepID=A0ABR6W142_9BACT|nr:primosomal protein N' [Spirosoma utsteinense]MBC3785078.1 primosomal protein N' (replication factor Y) [Spirosoma utsteinense]MBC3790313.1 primosomal protein N' (replication factor Y) [Spirosoma utsteinense]